MDLSALRAFLSVAENRSFSEAALELHLTQPAVSKRIAALEQQLQQRLFDRAGKQVRLTEAGDILLDATRQILQTSETAEDQIRSLGKQVRGRLRIATSHHVGIHRLPEPLKRFTRAYPEVELDLRFMDSELAAAEVRQGRVELAVATLPVQALPALESQAIWHDQLLVVSQADHPLLSMETVSLPKLRQYPAVLPARGTITRQVVDTLLGNEQAIRIALETNYLETIRVMVGVGLGWSVLPATMLNTDIAELNVNHKKLSRTLGLIRAPQHTLSVAAERFIEIIIQERDDVFHSTE